MDAQFTELERIESAKLLMQGMRTIDRTGYRRVHTVTRTIPGINTTVIAVLARYSSPIIVVSALYWSALTVDPTTMADVLISSDAETDADAETRDDKLSGLAGIGVGTVPHQTPLKIDYNLPILRAPIVLKAAFRTGAAANNTLMAHVLVEYA